MPHVIFDGSNIKLENFFSQGTGLIAHYEAPSPFQRGYGHFSSLARQRGAGVGSVLKNIWRYLRPLAATLEPIGKAVGKEALATTSRVLEDVASGKADLKESVAQHSREGMKNLLTQATSKLQQTGSGRGKRKKIRYNKRKPRIIIKPELIGQSVPTRAILKRKRADILGYY